MPGAAGHVGAHMPHHGAKRPSKQAHVTEAPGAQWNVLEFSYFVTRTFFFWSQSFWIPQALHDLKHHQKHRRHSKTLPKRSSKRPPETPHHCLRQVTAIVRAHEPGADRRTANFAAYARHTHRVRSMPATRSLASLKAGEIVYGLGVTALVPKSVFRVCQRWHMDCG